jgi:hypothetical protein
MRLNPVFYALMLVAPSAAFAQAPSANDEIIRLIAAKMPESIIIAKVNDLRGGLDKSTDALIKLREAGASDLVLAAVLSDKAIAVAAPGPAPTPKMPDPVEFKFNTVELVSIKALKSEFRVTLKLSNHGDKYHVFYGGRSVNYEPPLGSCEQASLSDDLGNTYPCKTLSAALRGNGGGGRSGAVVAPGDSISVVYGFARDSTTTSGSVFSFSAAPFADFNIGGIINADTQLWANLDVQFEVTLPSSVPK